MGNIGVILAILLGPYFHESTYYTHMSSTFLIGVLLSCLNMLPLMACFMLDKVLGDVEDGHFQHLLTAVITNNRILILILGSCIRKVKIKGNQSFYFEGSS